MTNWGGGAADSREKKKVKAPSLVKLKKDVNKLRTGGDRTKGWKGLQEWWYSVKPRLVSSGERGGRGGWGLTGGGTQHRPGLFGEGQVGKEGRRGVGPGITWTWKRKHWGVTKCHEHPQQREGAPPLGWEES